MIIKERAKNLLTHYEYVEQAVVFFGDHMLKMLEYKRVDGFALVGLYLTKNEEAIKRCKSFDDVIRLMNKANIKNFGELTQYDKALAMGIYLGLMPDKVLVHAGVEKALEKILTKDQYKAKVRKLENANKIKYIDVCELPKEFGKLKEPYLIEICLCYIHTNYLKGK